MSSPLETKVYVGRLSHADMLSILAHNDAFPTSRLMSELHVAVTEVCLDRLIRAEGCLRLARQFQSSTDDEELRTAVGRAYYSIHHSLRVMALWQNKGDPDGHAECIEQFKKLLSDKTFVRKSGLSIRDWVDVTDARSNRHVADYSPYSVQRNSSQYPDVITMGAWTDAATFNCDLADRILQAAYRTLTQ